jgi:transposase
VRLPTRKGRAAGVCLEATGIYRLDLALALHRAAGVEVMVVNPTAARDFGRALLLRSKTDCVDAGVLPAQRMPFEAWPAMVAVREEPNGSAAHLRPCAPIPRQTWSKAERNP